MPSTTGMGRLERFAHRRALKAWSRVAEVADRLDPAELARLNKRAASLHRQIDKVSHQAQAKLKGPHLGQDTIDKPAQCDWAWRPDCWRGPIDPEGIAGVEPATRLGEGLQLFHDCPLGEITLHQRPNTRAHAKAPFGIDLDILGFNGSFFSLVFDLPDAGRKTMRRSHIVRLTGLLELETPIEAYARLNVKHGPNTEQMVSQLHPNEDGAFFAEYDLGQAQMNEKRLENVWLDIIFDRPAMNRIVISDLTLMRRPRAEA